MKKNSVKIAMKLLIFNALQNWMIKLSSKHNYYLGVKMGKKGSKAPPTPPPNPQYPSTTGQPSGKGRGNTPKKK